MNLDELQSVWNSTRNLPTPAEQTAIVAQFTTTLRRRRRREMAWLAWTFFVLTVLTAFAGWAVFVSGKVTLANEWAVLPLLLIPWFFAFLFLRRFLDQAGISSAGDISIADSLRASMRANQSERFKLKAIGLMYLIALPVLAVCIWQLQSVGKVSTRELTSMVIFLGSALGLSAASVLAKYWFSAVPKGRRLQGLLSQFEQIAE